MPQNITVPIEMVDKLASIARAMLTLTKELKERAEQGTTTPINIPIPDLTPPDVIPPEDAWFWSEPWQKMEHEANEDIKEGRIHGPFTVDELLADLHS
jgi:hypothetical protein